MIRAEYSTPPHFSGCQRKNVESVDETFDLKVSETILALKYIWINQNLRVRGVPQLPLPGSKAWLGDYERKTTSPFERL